ncbi:hypothetical protein [Pseudonocardia phyllosphaerae]|uniref:hypothetical protein n=1 Tax=Pseudonocardia phyllosphaerae TaxID=3390502 RepID=UPI0039789F7F
MTFTPLSTRATGSTPVRHRALALRRALGVAAALGTLPYLGLKCAWLTGAAVGVTDAALLTSGSMRVLNAVTVVLDLCVVVLAAALGSRRAGRIPALAVLLPAWVATGLLLPMVVTFPLTMLAGGPAASVGLQPWVRPLVYGGFAWQGLCLLAAFAVYAADRWRDRLRRPAPVDTAVRPLLHATAGGGAVLGVLAAGLLMVSGAGSGSGVLVIVAALDAGFGLAGVVAVVRLARGRGSAAVVVTAWAGTAVPFANGLWSAVTTMGATALSGSGDPAQGLAQLCGLLGGFALAVAGLLAVGGSSVVESSWSPAPREPGP